MTFVDFGKGSRLGWWPVSFLPCKAEPVGGSPKVFLSSPFTPLDNCSHVLQIRFIKSQSSGDCPGGTCRKLTGEGRIGEQEALRPNSEILSVNHRPSLLWPVPSQCPSACTGDSVQTLIPCCRMLTSHGGCAALLSKRISSACGHSAFPRLDIPRKRKSGSLWIVLPSPCCPECDS